MESLFGKKNKQPTQTSTTAFGGYIGKIKTGSSKTKTKSQKVKILKTAIETNEKKSRKPTERMDRVPSTANHHSDTTRSKTNAHDIPAWIQESSEKKMIPRPRSINTGEPGESKLQWRKETKKSQRSFSKNKEKEYGASKSYVPKYTREPDRDVSESKPSWTPEKEKFYTANEVKKTGVSPERKSSWDKNSIKPGTGFKKSKTGYKGVGSAWDKSSAPRTSTRKWDTDAEKIAKTKNEGRVGGYKGKNPTWEKEKNPTLATPDLDKKNKREFPRPSFEKNTAPSPKALDIKPKYVAPKPTWEKESEVIDKKKLVDPTR